MEKAGEQGNGVDDGRETDSVPDARPRPAAPPPPPLGTALPPLQTRPVGSTGNDQSTWGLDDPTGPLPVPGAGASPAESGAPAGTIPAPPQPPMPPRPPADLAIPTTPPATAAVEPEGDRSVELDDIADPDDDLDSFEAFDDDVDEDDLDEDLDEDGVDLVDHETDDEFGEEIDTEFDEVDDEPEGRFEEIPIMDDHSEGDTDVEADPGLDTDLGSDLDLDTNPDPGSDLDLDTDPGLDAHIGTGPEIDTDLIEVADSGNDDEIDLRPDDAADDDNFDDEAEIDLDETVVHDLTADAEFDTDSVDTAVVRMDLDDTVAHEIKTGFDSGPAGDATESYDVRTALDPANPQDLSADQEANWSTVFGDQQVNPAAAADASPTVTETIDEGTGPATIAAATAATAATAVTAAAATTVAADASPTTVVESPMVQTPVDESPVMPVADLPTAFDTPDTATRQYDEFQSPDQTLVAPDGFVEGEPGADEPLLLPPDEQHGEPILAPVSTEIEEAETPSRSILTAVGGPLLAIVAAGAVWVALTTGSSPIIDPIHWPSPTAAIDAFNELVDEGFANTVGLTAARLGFALGLGAISGLLFGWLLGRFGRIRNLLRPLTSAFRILSPFLLAPFLLLWGLDRGIVSWLPAAVGVFAIVSWLATADVDDSRRGMSQNLGERLLMTLRTALVPAWTLVYATEMLVGVDGIGGRMRIALNFLEADVMAVWLLTAIVLAVAADLVLRLVQYLFARAARRRLAA